MLIDIVDAAVTAEVDTHGGREEKTGAYMNSPLYVIESLLQALTNSVSDGRVIINRPTANTAGKYDY